MVTVQWLPHRLDYMNKRYSCWVCSDRFEVVTSQFILRAHNVVSIDPGNVFEVHGSLACRKKSEYSKKMLHLEGKPFRGTGVDGDFNDVLIFSQP